MASHVILPRHRPWRILVVVEFDEEKPALTFERYLKSGSGREIRAAPLPPDSRGSANDSTGILTGDPQGGDGMCLFLNAPDRIYFISADRLTEKRSFDIARSLQ